MKKTKIRDRQVNGQTDRVAAKGRGRGMGREMEVVFYQNCT